MIRLIDTVKLVRYLRRNQPGMEISGRFINWLERQPQTPELVGGSVAAQILGVHHPHVARFVRQGRLKPVEVAGGANAYIKSEVLVLAGELAREREARETRRGGGA